MDFHFGQPHHGTWLKKVERLRRAACGERYQKNEWTAIRVMPASLRVENAVKRRYSAAAQAKVEALCCPVAYDRRYLNVIPSEILERDYGCGDPSQYLRPGETVLDLGSGAGKICFIAAQVVGPGGKVIGVDMNDDMLAPARKHQRAVGDAIGYHNIEFRKGRIQDLALDLERLEAELQARPIQGVDSFLAAEAVTEELRVRHPQFLRDGLGGEERVHALDRTRLQLRLQPFQIESEVLDAALAELDVVIADGVADRALVLPRQREHVVVHVHTDDLAAGTDDLRGDETNLARAAAQIEDRFARAQVLRRIAAAIIPFEDFGWDDVEEAAIVGDRAAERFDFGLGGGAVAALYGVLNSQGCR